MFSEKKLEKVLENSREILRISKLETFENFFQKLCKNNL